jgi:hypothetical protein
MVMDEMHLRTLAVALRSRLPDLLGGQDVARLDAELTAGLERLPGRALSELQRIMVWEAPEPVGDWVTQRLQTQPSLRLRLRSGDTRAIRAMRAGSTPTSRRCGSRNGPRTIPNRW